MKLIAIIIAALAFAFPAFAGERDPNQGYYGAVTDGGATGSTYGAAQAGSRYSGQNVQSVHPATQAAINAAMAASSRPGAGAYSAAQAARAAQYNARRAPHETVTAIVTDDENVRAFSVKAARTGPTPADNFSGRDAFGGANPGNRP